VITIPVKRFFSWLLGKPLQSRAWQWTEGILLGSLVVLLAYASIWGPLALFMPFAPPGFSSVSDGQNTVYFQEGDVAEAKRHLQLTREAQAAVLEFWESPGANSFPGGELRVYLCRSPETYKRLSLNRAPGSAAGGQAVYLNMEAQARRNTPSNDLRHEVSHIYVARQLGQFRAPFTVPRWFDEGTAAYLGDLPWQTPAHLAGYLADSPGLVSPTFLDGYRHWSVLLDGFKRYAHVRLFVSSLVEAHGQAKMAEYLRSLSVSASSTDTFEQVFGMGLRESHKAWVADMKSKGLIPADTEVVYPSKPGDSRNVLYVLLGVVMLLWLIRQTSRAVRLTGRLLMTGDGVRNSPRAT
jgi:hypothetical protein